MRRKYASLRRSLPTSISWILVLSLFVGLPSQVALSTTANAAACVPTTSTASNGDTILTFSSAGTCDWTVPSGVGVVKVLVVGAGAGGGGGSNAGAAEGGGSGGGGGGAGKVNYSEAISVTPGSVKSIVVGAGGSGGAGGMNGNTNWAGFNGSNGETSTAFSITSPGGIGGGGADRLLNTAASQTGTNKCNSATNAGSFYYIDGLPGFGGASASGQSGGNLTNCTTKKTIGAGGGGDSGAGANTGTGTAGLGTSNSITETAVTYSPGGTGGAAGGASGVRGADGAAKTIAGSGGNGGTGALSGIAGNASAGANGVVIVRFNTVNTDCVPVTSEVDTYTVLSFTTTGSCTWTVPTGVSSVEALVVGGGGSGLSLIHI